MRRLFCIAAFLGTILGFASSSVADDRELSRVWSEPKVSVQKRAEAVNRFFTNGTPMRAVVAILGTNYGVIRPFSLVWVGPGPEPRKTCSLFYKFGEDSVTIGTTADIGGDPSLVSSPVLGIPCISCARPRPRIGYELAKQTVQRTRAGPFAHRQIERQRRLAPVAEGLVVALHYAH